jgi:hypothetical protein
MSRCLVCVAVSCFCSAVAQIQVPEASQGRTLAAQVQVLTAALSDPLTGSPLAQIEEVAAKRAAILSILMEREPKAALQFSLSDDERLRVLSAAPDAAATIEQHGQWEGSLEVGVAEDWKERMSRVMYSIRAGGELLDVTFTEAPMIPAGASVRIGGIRLGKRVVANSATVLQRAAAAGACSTTGEQRSVAILFNTPSYKLATGVTASYVADMLFGPVDSVDSRLREMSYGKSSVSGTVVGPIDMPLDCDSGIINAVIQAADTQVDFRNYNRIVLVAPYTPACPIPSHATVGCRTFQSPSAGSFMASTIWYIPLPADYPGYRNNDVRGLTHELGHNLGLLHANSEAFDAAVLGALGAKGTEGEYGDQYSNMGFTTNGHWAAPQKKYLGWFDPADVQNVEADGSFVLSPLENTATGLKALRVRRGAGNDEWLWIENRQPLGYDAVFAGIRTWGALIHHELPYDNTLQRSLLLDFTPGSADWFNDAALVAGGSWSDPYSPLTLHVSGATGNALAVDVRYGRSCGTISPAGRVHDWANGVGTFEVSGSCSWHAVSGADWIQIAAGSTGVGPGTVSYAIQSNPGSPREGFIHVAGQKFTITQGSRPLDATPPLVTCAANPKTLWPANGKPVVVTVSGTIIDSTSGVDTSSLKFSVKDEYGVVQPTGTFSLGTGGNFSFSVSLIAGRNGNDNDGRTYQISATGKDNAGNPGSCSTTSTVPHDQGH